MVMDQGRAGSADQVWETGLTDRCSGRRRELSQVMRIARGVDDVVGAGVLPAVVDGHAGDLCDSRGRRDADSYDEITARVQNRTALSYMAIVRSAVVLQENSFTLERPANCNVLLRSSFSKISRIASLIPCVLSGSKYLAAEP